MYNCIQYVCIFVFHMYVCKYACMCMRACVNECVCIIGMHVCKYVCMNVYMYACTAWLFHYMMMYGYLLFE